MGEREIDHIATVDPAAPGENYSLLIVGVSNGDGDGGGVDGDGSECNSLSRQGAGTETSVRPDLVFDGGGARDPWRKYRTPC